MPWLEVGVANDYFLVHASRPPTDVSIELVEQLAPSGGACRGVVGAT